MAVIEPSPWRFTVADSPAGRLITIPAERDWWLLFFIPVWLVGWAVGEVMAGWILVAGVAGVAAPASAHTPNTGECIFLGLWLAFWTSGGLWAAYWWLWLVTGTELVEIGADTLIVRRKFAGWARTREYRLDHVSGVRVARHPERRRFSPIHSIAFDYGGRTIAFARRKNASELQRIIAALADREPNIAL